MTDLDKVVSKAIAEFGGTNDAAELERIKARYLGKSGALADAMKGLAKLAPETRREVGARVNAAKNRIETALVARREALAAAEQDHRAGPRLPRRLGRHAHADVPSGRGPVDRRGRELCRPERRAHRFPAQILRGREAAHALSSVVFPVYRALGRSRHELRVLRRRRLPRLRTDRMARGRRKRPSASERSQGLRSRQREVHG